MLQVRHIEKTSPSPGEQCTGSRWFLLPMDWPWSFVCSYLWQLGEDAGHPDEISVLVQSLLTSCGMLACASPFIGVHFIHIDVACLHVLPFHWCSLYTYRCGIPVVIMGETGCGKTRLVRYMCQLQARLTMDPSVPASKPPENFFIMKVRFWARHRIGMTIF